MTPSAKQDGIYTGGIAMLACAVVGGAAGFVTAFVFCNMEYTEETGPVAKALCVIGYTAGITCVGVSVAAVFALALAGSTLARSFAIVFGAALGWGLGMSIVAGADAAGFRPAGRWWDDLPAHLPLVTCLAGAWGGHCLAGRIVGFSRKARAKTSAGCAIGVLLSAAGFWLLWARLGLRLNYEQACVATGLCAVLGGTLGGMLGAIWGADRYLENDGFAVMPPLAVLPPAEGGIERPAPP